MTWQDEAVKKQIGLNIVVSIGGVFYAQKQPDSGLVIDADKLNLRTPRINGVSVDIRTVSTPIGSFSFQLTELHDSPSITPLIMNDASFFLRKEVIVYAGFIRGNFDFSDYQEIARTRVQNITKVSNGYSFRTSEVSSLVDEEALNVNSLLRTQMIPATTSLTVADGTNYPSSGVINIDGEFMSYSSKNGNILENLTRGLYTSDVASHEVGATVYLVTVVDEINPITLFLQIILSVNGDGTNHPTYDVLSNGLGLSPDDVDITGIEAIRDTYFVDEEHLYYIYNNKSMLKFLERTIFISTNTRLITKDGKIGLALLDEVDYSLEVPVFDESSVIGTPTWTLDDKKIVNVIRVQYDFNPATKNYEREAIYEESDSIASYGRREELVLQFEGVQSSLNGGVIVEERAQRLLGRLSTARGKVQVNTHFNAAAVNIGETVQLVHRFLPQQGGTLGIADRLEVMSRSINLSAATISTTLEFPSYTGIRIAFIGPSPRIVTVINQKTMEVDDASCLKEGWPLLLFKDGDLDIEGNPTAGNYLPDAINTIQSIVGNVVTFTNDFTSTLSNKVTLKLPDYDQATEDQKALYAFVGENAGLFNDGSKSYQVIF